MSLTHRDEPIRDFRRAIAPLALGLLILIGGGLRFWALGAKSVWLDEAASISFLDFSPSETLVRAAEPKSVHPPLFFLLLHPWSRIFGDSEFALRSLAALWGTIAIAGVYGLVAAAAGSSREGVAAGRGPALLAAALFAFSPAQIELARYVRGYTLAIALLLFSGTALLHALRGGRRWRLSLMTASVLAAGACYTNHLAVLVVGSQWIVAAAYLFLVGRSACESAAALENPRRPEKTARSMWVWFLLAGGMFCILYIVPWSVNLPAQSAKLRGGDRRIPVPIQDFLREPVFAVCGTSNSTVPPPAWISIIIVTVLLATHARLLVRGRWSELALVMPGLLPTLFLADYSMLSARSIFRARYLCFPQVFWLMSASVLICSLRSRLACRLLATLAVALSMYACYVNWRAIGPSANPGLRAAVRFVLDHRVGDEPVLVQNPFLILGTKYYGRGRFRPLLWSSGAKREDQIGSEHLKDADLIAAEKVDGLSHSSVWVLGSKSYSFEPPDDRKPPVHWSLIGRWTFKQDRRYELPVIVSRYRTNLKMRD